MPPCSVTASILYQFFHHKWGIVMCLAERSWGHSVCYLTLCKVATSCFAVEIVLLSHPWDSGFKKACIVDVNTSWKILQKIEKRYSFLCRDRLHVQARSYVIKFLQNEIIPESPGKGELHNKKKRIEQRVKAQNRLRVINRGGKQVSI